MELHVGPMPFLCRDSQGELWLVFPCRATCETEHSDCVYQQRSGDLAIPRWLALLPTQPISLCPRIEPPVAYCDDDRAS